MSASCLSTYVFRASTLVFMVSMVPSCVLKSAICPFNLFFLLVRRVSFASIFFSCSVAGLGGNPYRDGSFEYYISEKVRKNDPKGIGPFILADLELKKIQP